MGCCELRSDENTYVESFQGIRKYTRSRNSVRSSQKKVSFSMTQPGELRHSLAKRVLDLDSDSEPELHSILKQSEELLLTSKWIISYAKDWTQIKYIRDPTLGILIYIQINIASTCSVETVLNVLNNPDIRILWDIELSSFSILDGHRILDAKLSVVKKGFEAEEINRYVRYYRQQIALIEVAEEWKLCGLVLSEAENTIVELMTPLETDDLENTLKKKKLWAARLYQEIIKEQ